MRLAQNWFLDWFNSPYYHQLYHYRDENEANKFLNVLISHLKPDQNAIMLDVACGRGRHAKALAAKGFDVTGIDIAPDSIEFAKQFEDEQLHFYIHDMRLPFWINYFDYAFNFFTSFGYFRTEREHFNAIRSIAGAIKDNGFFVLDYINVNYVEEHLVPESETGIDGVDFTMKRWSDEKHFFKRIMITDHNTNEDCEYTERIAKILPNDFERMFSRYELRMQEMFGDYELHAFDKNDSPRLIMLAKKIIH
jgi:SAM-dependent methyltransferase